MSRLSVSSIVRLVNVAAERGAPIPPEFQHYRRAVTVSTPDPAANLFAAAGLTLHAKQHHASAAALACDEPEGPTEVGYGGARSGGKSLWLLAQIAAADCQRCPGLKALILRKVGKAVRESFEDLRLKVLARIPHEYRRQEGVIAFPNGSRIVLGHFKDEKDIDAYLGLEYDVIGVEEATTLTASKYSAIRTCNRTSKTNWRPRIYSTTNPGGVGHAWYKSLFIEPYRREEQTTTRFIQATVYDNPHVNPEYVKTLEALPGWQRAAWLEGDWDIAAGQFFTNFRRDLHVIRPIPLLPSWRKWCALDYGFTHYTVVHLLAEDGDGNLYVVDEHAERNWLPQRHAPAVKNMLARHGLEVSSLWKFVAGADVFAKRPDGGTVADTYAGEGIHLEAANDDRINGAAEVLKRLGDRDCEPAIPPTLSIMDRCARLIECLPALQHDPHRPEDVLKWDTDEDGQGGDDAYDSARYGIMAACGRVLRFR